MIWKLIAWVVSRRRIARWLYLRAMKTPHRHLTSANGLDLYVGRWWLFNQYDDFVARRKWLPSIRLHHIMRADHDRHLHDHPWNARTVILAGFYIEEREGTDLIRRSQGSTASLKFGEFHRIVYVPPEGVWTLFITWRYRGTWGFKVGGVKVSHLDYLK